jgi:hypothetical protein
MTSEIAARGKRRPGRHFSAASAQVPGDELPGDLGLLSSGHGFKVGPVGPVEAEVDDGHRLGTAARSGHTTSVARNVPRNSLAFCRNRLAFRVTLLLG